jgi:ABC-type dipeptide/oligopeptide/nickel transport system permease subunit
MVQGEQAAGTLTAPSQEVAVQRRHGILAAIWKFIRRKPLGAVGFGLVIFLFLMTIGAPTGEVGSPSLPDRPFGFELGTPFMARYDDEDKFYEPSGRLKIYASPDFNHWLGTDGAGRDTWARIVVGSRRSLYVGIWALIVASALGTAIGVVSGYFGSWVDTIVQRFMDALQSFPPLIALILIVSINPLAGGETSSLMTTAVILGIVGVTSVQRITRGVVLATREQQYVEAGRVIGATDSRIMLRYIVPNIMASIIVIFSTGVGVVILAEAALSFIVPEKVPGGTSWGLMLSEEWTSLSTEKYVAIFSASAIAIAVLAFNLAGDALRDVLDPRLRLQ